MIQLLAIEPIANPRAALGQFWAVVRDELRMQWRRLGLWLAFAGALSLIIMVMLGRSASSAKAFFVQSHATATDSINIMISAIGLYGIFLLAPIAALMVSDRIARDNKLHMTEMQHVTPQSTVNYVLGKFLGNYIAVLLPTLLILLILTLLVISALWPQISFAMLWGQLLAFLLIFMPVYAAIIGLVLLLSTLLPLRAIQIGIPLLWFYSVLSPLHWTTINDTIFNPRGRYIYPVFFATSFDRLHPTGYTITDALQNIGALLLVAVVSLVILIVLRERQARQGIVK